MKRFHVHLAVEDLAASIYFYSRLFGQSPSRQEPDYAKWMLEDPRLNFAISSRGHAPGINHLGMQADSPEELEGLRVLAESASGGHTLDQDEVACCYAKSEKHWTIDPQGLAWEHFLTLSDARTFGDDTATRTGACCIPLRPSGAAAADQPASCCVPQEGGADRSRPCCG